MLLLTLALIAAAPQATAQDSIAAAIVDQYIKRLDIDAIPSDSLLYVESRIIQRGYSDTLIMRRWKGTANRQRVELWYEGTLQKAFYSDGRHLYRSYDTEDGKWHSINADKYYDLVQPYSIGGPLQRWRVNGEELSYGGIATLDSSRLYRILATSNSHYDRQYFIDCNSRLLVLYTESNSVNGEPLSTEGKRRVDWHAYTEYQTVGNMLLPSKERYQHAGNITLIEHAIRFVKTDEKIFNSEKIR